MTKDILMITSFPPRECGIATYSQDLITAIQNKFHKTFDVKICAIETDVQSHFYKKNIQLRLNTDHESSYVDLSNSINANDQIGMVLIQHEFGFFYRTEKAFLQFLVRVENPILVVFHTVLPTPVDELKRKVVDIAQNVQGIVVMTQASASILINEYQIDKALITVIPHGTHLVPHTDKAELKERYGLTGKEIISTFGLLSAGKSIETTLNGLPDIIEKHPQVLFLIIGKTHPSVLNEEGEKYRDSLIDIVNKKSLQHHVKFINAFLPLEDLLDYLQLTDVYLFTSKDRNQAVSGTFSYAISTGCPIVSTPIPHAVEVLKNDAGIIVDFENSDQLAKAVRRLLDDEQERKRISSVVLHRMAATAWENTAIAHVDLFQKLYSGTMDLNYRNPEINFSHLKKMTTDFGILQFSEINHPDLTSGYTLDDNARALIAVCKYYQLSGDSSMLFYIKLYYDFIKYCLQSDGTFLNYVDVNKAFTSQNNETNLADSNGRAIWALGYLSYINTEELPIGFIGDIEDTIDKATQNAGNMYSTRAMAFTIKGLHYRSINYKNKFDFQLISLLADRLVQMYRHEQEHDWNWFESYLTYANSLLPEALLCAWITTNNPAYKSIAKDSFDFLLSKIINEDKINVISNKNWFTKGDIHEPTNKGGEQPIDVAYTILALEKFSEEFPEDHYNQKIGIAFNWFLGVNHLKQIIYNPCTGGCYDGLEQETVNLNQGSESTISYLLSRLIVENRNLRLVKKREQQNVLLNF